METRIVQSWHYNLTKGGFPGGPVVKNPAANAGDAGSVPVWEDPTGLGVAEPAPGVHAPQEKPPQSEACHRSEDPAQPQLDK